MQNAALALSPNREGMRHGFNPVAAMGLLLLSVVALSPSATAADPPTKPPATSAGGCWSMGRWYPEGHELAPDPRSRIVARGVFVCRSGSWVFKRT